MSAKIVQDPFIQPLGIDNGEWMFKISWPVLELSDVEGEPPKEHSHRGIILRINPLDLPEVPAGMDLKFIQFNVGKAWRCHQG